MAAGSIVIDLLMRTGSFSTDTKRAEKELAALRKEAVAAGAAIGVAFAGIATAAAYMGKNTIDALDALNDRSQSLGVTAKALQEFGYAATFSGVNAEVLDQGLTKLSNTIADAASGNEKAVGIFKSLGVAIKDSGGQLRGTDDILKDIAEKFAGTADGASKTAMAVDIFGKSGAKLIPFLNEGKDGLQKFADEAARMGVVVGDDAVQAAAKFNDQLDRLNMQWTGLKNGIIADVLPALIKLADQFETARKAGLGFWDALNTLPYGPNANSLAAKDQQIATATKRLEEYRKKLEELEQPGGPFQIGIRLGNNDSIRAQISDTEKLLQVLQKQRENLERAGAGRQDPRAFSAAPVSKPQLALPLQSGSSSLPKPSDFDRYLENLQKQLEKVQDLTIAEQVLADLRAGRVGDVSPEQEKIFFDLAKRIELTKDAAKSLEDLRKEEERERSEEEKGTAAAEARLQALLDQGPAAALDKQRDSMLLLVQALESGRISAEQYQDAVTGILDLNPEIDKQKSLVEELGLSFTSAFEDAIVAGKKLSDVLQGVLQDILRIVVRRNITEPLGKAISGNSEGLFSGVGDFFSNIFGGFFAGGGEPPVGKASIVGENGPEWFIPNSPGTIIPNGEMAGGGGMVVNIMNNAPGVKVTPTERQENGVRQLDIMIDQIDQALGQRVARGTGALTGAMQNRWALGRARG